MPLISVIMSVYNDEKYVSQAIDSILNQTFRDFEFIITDDCSKDNSLSIIREYAQKDNRIVLIENTENLKLTKNLNNMLDRAKGKLIARMDSDDICFPERFEKQIDIFKTKPVVDFVFTGTILIDSEGNEICESWRPKNVNRILKKMKNINFIPHPTIMAKKELFIASGKYTEHKGYGQEDKELWEKMILIKANFYYLEMPMLYYRLNPKGVSYSISKAQSSYNYKMICYCLDNNAKLRAISLLKRFHKNVSLMQLLDILIKLILPLKLRYFRIEMKHYFKTKLKVN